MSREEQEMVWEKCIPKFLKNDIEHLKLEMEKEYSTEMDCWINEV